MTCLSGTIHMVLDLLTTYTHNLELQIITASSLISTANTKSFPSCHVFISHSLVMAYDSGDSSTSALRSSLKWLLPSN